MGTEATKEHTQSSKNQPASPRAQSFMSRNCRIQKLSTHPPYHTTKPQISPGILGAPRWWKLKTASDWQKRKGPSALESRCSKTAPVLKHQPLGLPANDSRGLTGGSTGLPGPEGRNGISQCSCQETKHSRTWTARGQRL